MIKFFSLFLVSFLYIIFCMPAHAYAGPGAAFGAIIVFITVILAFFASTLLGVFNFLRINLKKFLSFLKSKNEKKKNLRNKREENR